MADLISAIASLLWPLLVIVVLLVFGRQLLSKLRSSDDVTLEIGGQRLNFKQATDQQSDMITDLQREVAALKRRLDDVPVGPSVSYDQRQAIEVPEAAPGGWAEQTPGGGAPWPTPGGGANFGTEDAEEFEGTVSNPFADELEPWTSAPTDSGSRSILWVDDHPENNAMLAESWRRDGTEVETARSTSEALRMLGRRTYGLVISDIGRRESAVEVPDAGLRLLTKVRETNPVLPFVLYGNVGSFADDARAAGATKMTDSTFELVEFATGLGLLDGA